MIKKYLEKIINLEDLSQKEMEKVFEDMMSGALSAAEIAAFLVGLRIKGESVDEITAAAKVMRKKAMKIDRDVLEMDIQPALDTCGTGGTKIDTFNISTCSAFVIAGNGVKIAKHGNRSASSSCGSADVLEELGVNLNISPEKSAKCIKEIGIGFLFAPIFHSAMKYAAPIRKEIGIRTIFNILGPLSNPANVNAQVLGVYDVKLVDKLCRVLKNLGVKRAFVVHGKDSLDEITITGPTYVAELKKGKIKNYTLRPSDFGFKKRALKDIKGGNAKTNASIILKILKGEHSPKREIVLMNASCGLVASERAKNFKEGVLLASESIDSGRAFDKLNRLIEFTNIS